MTPRLNIMVAKRKPPPARQKGGKPASIMSVVMRVQPHRIDVAAVGIWVPQSINTVRHAPAAYGLRYTLPHTPPCPHRHPISSSH